MLLPREALAPYGHAEPSEDKPGRNRNWPDVGLRFSGGAPPTERLFTGQARDLGNDSSHFFKARYYDATIGQFQVPDLALPDYSKGGPQDPQCLNRYAYALNNPLRLVDPAGRAVMDPPWVQQFESAHGGQVPMSQDWGDYQFSLGHAGTGPGGTWAALDWGLYGGVEGHLGQAAAQAVWSGLASAEGGIENALSRFIPHGQPDYLSLNIEVQASLLLPALLIATGDPRLIALAPFARALPPVLYAAAQVIRDRYGRWYLAFGDALGPPAVASASVTGGWVLQPDAPCPDYLYGFITGWSLTASGGDVAGGGFTWGDVGVLRANAFSAEMGFFTPGSAGLSATWAFEFYPELQGP